ncbi:MAG: hypothetical protein JL50_09030 [Peptococcaceae bacterium BICA1-7]|nr:MAG: hypothetical protein JL50_09030 [Peptococcaceae bacterium BICA1-7]HBV97204.1 hypothetical protein [Desulfotomaculum sp.]
MGKKIAALLVALLLWAVLIAGCGQENSAPQGETLPHQAGPGGEVGGEVSAVEFNNIFGTYVGQADGNFIEIRADGGSFFPGAGQSMTFLVPDGLKGELAHFKKDDPVNFDCFKNKQQQWEINRLEKEGRVIGQDRGEIEKGDFTVKVSGGAIELGVWDKDMDLVKMLGGPLTERIEKLGPGADTFTGSYIKRQYYDGLELGFMSPADNGKTFLMDRIVISGGQYQTARGIKVGDGYERVLQTYVYAPPDNAVYDQKNHTYSFKDSSTKLINFEVKNGLVKSIALFIEHP